MRVEVILYEIHTPMLILSASTGVVYRNQVGGVVNVQERMEGVLVPIELSDALEAALDERWFQSGRAGITLECADRIDAVFLKRPALAFLRVDRKRIHESSEAWVYVTIAGVPEKDDGSDPGYCGPIFGIGDGRGVLTWANSD